MKMPHQYNSYIVKRLSLFIILPLLVLVSLLSFKFANAAGITFIQANQSHITSGTTVISAFSKANTAGNLIVVNVSWSNSGTVAVTDSRGNTYTAATPAIKWGGTNSSEVFYAKNIAAGSNTITVTFGTAISTYGLFYMDEYSGLNTTNPVDVTSSAVGTAAAMNSGLITTTNANDLIYGVGSSNNTVTATGSGFTNRTFAYGNIVEDKTVTAIGSYNAAANQNSNAWVMHMVAFRAASADTTPPSSPTNLSAAAASTSQINLSWTASTDNVGVTGYKIFRNGVLVGTSATTMYSDTGLTAGTTYTYTVSAFDAAGNNSALSSSAASTTKTPDTTPPTAPANLVATITSQTQASLNWTASTDNVGVTGYNVYRSTTANFTPNVSNKIGTTTTATSYADSGLSITTYYYLVTASDAAGNFSTASNQASLVVADITVPSTPANLVATAASATQINLSWAASTDNIGVTGYKIFRNGTQVGTSATATYGDTGLTPSTVYSYTVSAVDASGNNSASSSSASATTPATPDTTPPLSPANVQATIVSQTQVNLAWTASTDNVGVTGYIVYRSTTAGFTPSAANKIGTTTSATSYSDNGLRVATYYYLVTAVDAAGNASAASNQATATITDVTAPTAPANLGASETSVSQVSLLWTAASDNVGVTSYTVYRSSTPGFTPASANQIAMTAVTTFIDNTVTLGTYYYLIIATDAAGNSSVSSNLATVTVADTTPPSVPASPIATPISTTQINLSWTASTDDVGVIGYNVFRNGILIATTTDTSYNDISLNPSTSYAYTINSFDAAGNSSTLSSTINTMTQSPPDVTPPSVPSNVVAIAASSTQINVSWTASSDDVSVAGYNVYRNGVQVGTSIAPTYIDSGLNPVTTYSYTVSAFDAAGNVSLPSSAASATTQPTPDTTPPTAPTNLVASGVSQTQINLAWVASSDDTGVTSYNVYRSLTVDFTPGPTNLIATTTDPSFDDTSVRVGTYYYQITALDAAGNASATSNEATSTIADITAPTVPSNLTATAASITQVNVSWTASSDDVAVAGYSVYRNGTQVGTTTSSSYQDTSLASGTTYSYTVAAFDAAGNLSTPAAAAFATTLTPDITPPSTPTNLVAVTISMSQINLAWNSSTDNVGVAGYQIFRDGIQVGTSVTTAYSDTGLTAGSTHSYAITAFDTAGNVSAPSDSISATTTTPDTTPPSVTTTLTAITVSQTQINLTWTAATDNVGVVGYTIYRSTTNNFTPSSANQIGSTTTATSYNDSLTVGVGTYYYLVVAADLAGNLSAASNQATASIPDIAAPSLPASLTATAISPSQIKLAWTASTDNIGVAGYNIYRNGTLVTTVISPSYTDSGLISSTTYSYRVSAYDAAGNTSAQTTSVSATTPDATPPSVPTNLSATTVSAFQINLSWTASSDNVGVAGYQIFRNEVLVGTTAATTYSDIGLAGNTAYSYTLAAFDAAGNLSAQTASVNATTKNSVTPGNWTSIAPAQVSTNFNSPANNFGFNSIVLDPTNPNIIFIGTNYQGIWKSTDQGTTWAKIDTGTGSNLVDGGRLWTLAIDPYNHNTLWTTAGYGAGGPLKSTDGGVSWSLISVGSPTQYNDVYGITIDPFTPNHILVTWHSPWSTDNNNSGVSESLNGGTTWINHQPPAGSNWGSGTAAWFLNNSQTWLLGSQSGGIWRTTNSGTTWSQVLTDPITHGGINSLASAGGTLYLAHSTSVSKSTDNGVTWTGITSGLPFGYYETVVSDGTHVYTAPSFPTANYTNGPWYSMPLSGGTWQADNASPHTCYNSNCNGPIMGAYDATNHIAYAVNWLGGVWKRQGP